jgi:hypothetical protein
MGNFVQDAGGGTRVISKFDVVFASLTSYNLGSQVLQNMILDMRSFFYFGGFSLFFTILGFCFSFSISNSCEQTSLPLTSLPYRVGPTSIIFNLQAHYCCSPPMMEVGRRCPAPLIPVVGRRLPSWTAVAGGRASPLTSCSPDRRLWSLRRSSSTGRR